MKSTLAMVLIFCVSLGAFGQQGADTDVFSINEHGFGGFSLNYRGQEYGTAFGLAPQVSMALRSDVKARPWVDGYNYKLIGGNLMFYGGLASMVVSMVTTKAKDKYGDPRPIPLGFVAGLTSLAASFFVIGSGSGDLRNAVQTYNFDLKAIPVGETAPVPPGPAPTVDADESAPSDMYIEEGWFSTFKLYYHQVAYDTGFGVDKRLLPILSADPDLRSRLGTSDVTRAAGWGLLGAGLIAWPVGLFTGLYGMLADGPNSRQATVGFGIGIAGMVTALLVSPVVLYAAGAQVRSVVKDYNARLP